MAWNTPITWVASDPLSASDLNAQLRDNLLHLFSQFALAQIVRNGAADYTRTANTFADVDSTNLKITATIESGRAVCFATFSAIADNTSGSAGEFTFARNGTDMATLARLGQNNNAHMTILGLMTGIPVGSHEFTLRFRNAQSGALITIRNNGWPMTFGVWGF